MSTTSTLKGMDPSVLVVSSPGPPVMTMAACPVVVAYRQGGADLCAAYGLASAVHHFGDIAAAASIAACAATALVSGDAFGYVRSVVRTDASGWCSTPLAADYNPLSASCIAEPILMQLVGSDGAGTHAVGMLRHLIFDATEEWALLLSRAALDRCVGKHLNGATFSHVARAVRLTPGKSVRKWLRQQR